MRVPVEAHEAQPWRIHQIAPDFRLEDVWALPVDGLGDDFGALVALMTCGDDLFSRAPRSARAVWAARDRLGAWLGIGRTSVAATARPALPIPGTAETSLSGRLPADLSGTVADVTFDNVPFTPLYRTDDEFAAELSNRTVHAVMHLAWVPIGDDRFRGELAVYVKPRGLLGGVYLALIRPFRYAIVYPALLEQIERAWNGRPHAAPAQTGSR